MEDSNSLVIFSRAAIMLAEADTIQKAKELKSLALTAADWAKRKNMGEEAIQHCRSYALEAERKMGQMLRETDRAKGQGERGSDGKMHQRFHQGTAGPPTYAELGLRKKEAFEAQLLATLPDGEFEKVAAGEKTKTQVKRESREAKREAKRLENSKLVSAAKSPSEIEGKFSAIVIDPPWDWGDEGDINQLGRARPDYATMTIGQLMDLPVGKLASDDCHLYMWITNRSLPKGFGLMERWGFRYVTALTWPKPSFGMGNYFRGQTEHVLFGVKGALQLKRKNAATLLPSWKRGQRHSEKPSEFLEFVESCSPGPYLEMFSRFCRDGWVTWGENV